MAFIIKQFHQNLDRMAVLKIERVGEDSNLGLELQRLHHIHISNVI